MDGFAGHEGDTGPSSFQSQLLNMVFQGKYYQQTSLLFEYTLTDNLSTDALFRGKFMVRNI